MKFSDVELPSNKKFGLFLSSISILITTYFFYVGYHYIYYFFCILSVLIIILSLTKNDLFLPINKLWMKFGLILGIFISPIILGLIFFILISPISIFMRICGRDELSLKMKKKLTHWNDVKEYETSVETFKQQF